MNIDEAKEALDDCPMCNSSVRLIKIPDALDVSGLPLYDIACNSCNCFLFNGVGRELPLSKLVEAWSNRPFIKELKEKICANDVHDMDRVFNRAKLDAMIYELCDNVEQMKKHNEKTSEAGDLWKQIKD